MTRHNALTRRGEPAGNLWRPSRYMLAPHDAQLSRGEPPFLIDTLAIRIWLNSLKTKYVFFSNRHSPWPVKLHTNRAVRAAEPQPSPARRTVLDRRGGGVVPLRHSWSGLKRRDSAAAKSAREAS